MGHVRDNPLARQRARRHTPLVKILVNCGLPFALAHGGQAIQIEQTMAALQAIGLTVEPLRWWDRQQTGDLIHFFGRMPADQIRFAHQQKFKIVMAEFLSTQGTRTPGQLRMQRTVSRTLARWGPRTFTTAFQWEAYQLADALVANTAWEKHLMEYLFGAAPTKTSVVPNGVEAVFFQPATEARGPWLVCTATITERKRVLELAEAAIQAQTPVWIIGQPYSDQDHYVRRFLALAKSNPQFIRYEGAIGDRAELAKAYRSARGFVLLSSMETRSLSAEEAAACGCPLLLSDLPWARGTFSRGVEFCPVTKAVPVTADALRRFYEAAPQLPPPPRPATWPEVARQFQAIYERVLSAKTSRHSV